MVIIKLKAAVERRTGNPRAIYVRINNGKVDRTWDENYLGIVAIPLEYRHLYQGCIFNVSVPEYLHYLKCYIH
jgi:hypothetical protein